VVEVLERLRKHSKDCRMVFLSSAAVYGDPECLPVDEGALIKPISAYGFHKRQAELACKEYAVCHGLKTASVRIFSAYGEGLRRQVVWDLANKVEADSGDVLKVFGTGLESRDFIHCSDVAQGILRVVREAPFEGECYNLASGVEVRIADLAQRLCSSLGVDKEIVFNGVAAVGSPKCWRADIAKIRALGFEPSVDLNDGLKRFVEWKRSLIL
jgi:UDP-glucose 4-epimerase